MCRIAFLLVAFAGCAPQTSGDDPTCTDVFFADTDGDGHGDAGAPATACSAPSGYVATDDDCDDSQVGTHPGANEVCNGLDDDCDARIDDDAIDVETWYADADLDGFGDEATTTTACSQPEGYIAVAGDCADDDAEINPDADELCNDLDDDCDELVDTLDPSLVQGTVWYADADADGYGDPATGAHACEPQVGKITDGTDCDDADPAVHPSVDERCNEKDDDCDGLVDGDDDGLVDGLPFYADADGDGYGDEDAVVSDCSEPTGYVDNTEDCDDGDATVGPSPDYYLDADGDGYGDGALVHTCTPTASLVTVDGDCRDTDEDIYPGATEICDHRDNNCDGLSDDDDPLVVASTIWYGDGDGDGYGDPLDTLAVCARSAGYVRDSTDCDDTDAELHPGATEYCDGIDNDCDGTTDDSVVYSDWYPDDDGDGYGVTEDAKNDCVAPSGYIAVSGDCDDASLATHPGATELCANEVDDDCDTDVDDCQISSALADFMAVGGAWSWFAHDLDLADVDADGVSDLLVGSFVDQALYVVYGPASGTTTTASLVALRADTTITAFGSAIGAGDANDDGVDDVLAGSDHIDGDGTSYLFLGPITADRGTTDADAVLAGPADSWAGCRLDVVGDFDGDGASDVVVGAPGDTFVLATVYVATGPISGAFDLAADAAYLYEGASADSDLGGLVQRVGDMNADGIDDLALDDWSGPGTVYLIDGGSAPGTYAVDVAASATLTGERNSQFGNSMKSVDYDADGTLDLVVGALTADSPGNFDAGVVFAFLGPLSGSLDGRDAAVVWAPDARVERLGSDIAVGDVDGDGSSDLLLGALWSELYGGKAFLQLGPASGVVEVDGLPSFDGASGECLGSSVAIVPDWTGDDRDEVALAAPYHTDAAGDIAGAVYAFDSESIFGP